MRNDCRQITVVDDAAARLHNVNNPIARACVRSVALLKRKSHSNGMKNVWQMMPRKLATVVLSFLGIIVSIAATLFTLVVISPTVSAVPTPLRDGSHSSRKLRSRRRNGTITRSTNDDRVSELATVSEATSSAARDPVLLAVKTKPLHVSFEVSVPSEHGSSHRPPTPYPYEKGSSRPKLPGPVSERTPYSTLYAGLPAIKGISDQPSSPLRISPKPISPIPHYKHQRPSFGSSSSSERNIPSDDAPTAASSESSHTQSIQLAPPPTPSDHASDPQDSPPVRRMKSTPAIVTKLRSHCPVKRHSSGSQLPSIARPPPKTRASLPPARTRPYEAPFNFPTPRSPGVEDYIRQTRKDMQRRSFSPTHPNPAADAVIVHAASL